MHHPYPPTPPAAYAAGETAALQQPWLCRAPFEAAPECAAHDFLVAITRPDLIPNPGPERSDAIYTVDLP